MLLAARLLLAAVFAVAAVAKLADREGSRRAAVDFGVPAGLGGLVALVIPLAELAVAVALLPSRTAVWGGLGALALLLLFSAAIVSSLARGRAPDCHCFGQLHSEPAGRRTLLRNGALAAMALLVVAAGWNDPGLSAVAWIARLDTAGALAAAALAAAVAAGLYAVGGHRRLASRMRELEERLASEHRHAEPVLGLPVGSTAPEFSLPDMEGDELALVQLRMFGRPVLLVFTDPGCGPCESLMPEVARWQREHEDLLTVAVLSSGRLLDARAKAEEHGLEFVLSDEHRAVYRDYEGAGTPCAALVDKDGKVAWPLAAGAQPIVSLVEGIAAQRELKGLTVGEPLPDIEVSGLDGRSVSLSSLAGEETVFLLWDPGCGFCRSVHDDVLEWEVEAPPGAARLVVISAGKPDEVRAEGFRSTVLLDPERRAVEALGAGGTPSAILVDAGGRVAWPLAIGAEQVLRIARSKVPAGARA